MLYAGLDLSRQKLDVHILDETEGRSSSSPFGPMSTPYRCSSSGSDGTASPWRRRSSR
jgi:hypothetical protein